MRLALQLFDAPGGNLLADWSNGVNIMPRTNDHGFASLTCFIPLSLADSFRFYDASQGKHLSLNYGAGVVWEGRVEDPKIVDGGLQVTALGYWRAFSDVPYTALWSKSGTAGWEIGINDENASFYDKRFSFDSNNRLFISPNKNQVFTSGVLGAYRHLIPDSSSRNLVGVEFSYVLDAPSGWQCRLAAMTTAYALGTTIWEITSSGAAAAGSVHFSITGTAGLAFWLRHNTGTPTVFTGENGASYLRITNLRITTSVASRINTSVAASISAGAQVVTPASMAGIGVGANLIINSSAASERIAVTAVTATTFTATFASAHNAGALVRALRIYASEIIKDLVSHVTAVNADQLSDSTALIESPGLDLLDEVYEDELPADIATKLAGLGDDQDPPRRWEVGVWENQAVHFRPRGSAGQSWSVDSERLVVDGTLAQLFNSAYGVYQDASNRTLRTAVSDDDASQARYGLVRRAAVAARTTSSTQAGVHRDAFLADRSDLTPRGDVEVDLLMDATGAIYPKWMARSGDTFTLRNLPPVLSESIDKIRTFLLAETAYDVDNDVIKPVPESPIPSLELLVARRAEGVG